jgi:structural maintenance of chromosome 4
VEKEKDRLEEGKKEAETWLRLKNDHVRAQSRLWQWYLWKCLINAEEFARKLVSFGFSLVNCLAMNADEIQQARTEKELKEETNRNKDDIEHHHMLEKHYEEREKAYEVGGLAIVRLPLTRP